MNSSLRRFAAVLVTASAASIANAKIERTVEREFAVSGAGLLTVETSGGSVRVTPGPGQAVKVTATQRIDASNEAEADELLKKLELTFDQAGNDIRVVSKYEKRPSLFRWGSWPPVHVDITVTVPAAFATQLSTSGGSITVGNLDGKAVLRTSGGAIKVGQMGASVDARTSGGGITLDGARGPVELKTSGGSISVGRIEGPADLSTSGGGIKIASTTGGLRAHTSGGSIQAAIAGPLKEESSLSTSGGSVSVTVDKSAAFRLDASTSGGGVNAAGLTMTLDDSSRDRNRLAGVVNGGGPTLKLRTSGGGIRVSAQ